jgi:hypothetical protein
MAFLELRNAQGALVASDDNWMDNPTQKAVIIAAGLPPSDILESAIAVTLMPGAYTALLSGTNNGTGVGLVEVYDHTGGSPTPTATPGGSATPIPSPGSGTPTPTQTPTPTPGSTPSPTPATCTENFDGVTAPALPNGWVASDPIPGNGVLWVTSTVGFDSPPNAAFIPDQDGISDKVLDRSGVTVTSTNATLSFRNNFNTELFFDGFVLEVSSPNISGGDFLDITDPRVGGSFFGGGYTGTIKVGTLTGRTAWTGNSNGYIDTVINLGPNLVGQSATFRFRMVTDEAESAPGVHIDSLLFTGASCP